MTIDERLNKIQELSVEFSELPDGERTAFTTSRYGGMITAQLINICSDQNDTIKELKSDMETLQRKLNRVKFEAFNEER